MNEPEASFDVQSLGNLSYHSTPFFGPYRLLFSDLQNPVNVLLGTFITSLLSLAAIGLLFGPRSTCPFLKASNYHWEVGLQIVKHV